MLLRTVTEISHSQTDVRSAMQQTTNLFLQRSARKTLPSVTALTEPLCIIDELMAIWRLREVFKRLSDSFRPVAVQWESVRLFLKYMCVSHLFTLQSCPLEGTVMSQITENLPLASRCICCMGRIFAAFPPAPEVFQRMPTMLILFNYVLY